MLAVTYYWFLKMMDFYVGGLSESYKFVFEAYNNR